MSRTHPTASQTVGPFFAVALVGGAIGAEMVPAGTPGSITVEGVVLDGAGAPVNDAMLEIWQADSDGHHGRATVSRRSGAFEPRFTGFARAATDGEGHFRFVTVKPGAVPHPDGGVQAPHLVVSVFARGLLKRLVTRIYFPDEVTANAADPILGRLPPEGRATLVARATAHGVEFDVRLQGPGQTVFFAL